MRLALSFLVILLTHATTEAKPPAQTQGTASLEFVVKGGGGSFDVPVSPSYVTVLYLPGKVTRAFASDQENFAIHAAGDTVTVRPNRQARGKALRANLNIETESLRLAIILKVVDKDEDAVSQVFFVPAEEKAEMERRVKAEVERILRPIREEYERKNAELGRLVADRADTEIVRRSLERFESHRLKGIERTGDNVIFRVSRAAYLGETLLVFYSVENRSGRTVTVGGADLEQAGRTLAAERQSFRPLTVEKGRPLLRLPDGETGRGVLALSASSLAPGRPFAVRFRAPTGKLLLAVRKIRLD